MVVVEGEYLGGVCDGGPAGVHCVLARVVRAGDRGVRYGGRDGARRGLVLLAGLRKVW